MENLPVRILFSLWNDTCMSNKHMLNRADLKMKYNMSRKSLPKPRNRLNFFWHFRHNCSEQSSRQIEGCLVPKSSESVTKKSLFFLFKKQNKIWTKLQDPGDPHSTTMKIIIALCPYKIPPLVKGFELGRIKRHTFKGGNRSIN